MWDERTEGAVSGSEDSTRFLPRLISECVTGDLRDCKRPKELLGIRMIIDSENIPEWEEDACVDPNGGFLPPEPMLAMEDCIDWLLRTDDDELANEIPVFCRMLCR